MLNVQSALLIVTYVKKQKTPKVFFFFPFSSSFPKEEVSLKEQYNLGIFLRVVCGFYVFRRVLVM
jgi:hypothetical protein